MKTLIYKLTSGEEVIATVVRRESEFDIVRDTAQVVMRKTDDGFGLGLAPFLPYCTGEIKLYFRSFVAEAEPNTDMYNEYSRIFGSGLVVPQPSSMVK